MKSYKPLYLQRLLLGALFWALPSTSMAVENPRLELLKENYGHQKLTRQLNKATALALESCLCQQLGENSPAKSSCQNTPEVQSFTRKFYNITGNLTEMENSCRQLLEELVRKPLREKYEQMKIDLALSAPVFKDDNILLVEYDTDNSLKMKTHAQHPFKAPFINKSWTGVPIEALTALQSTSDPNSPNLETELSKALREFNEFRDNACASHFLSLRTTDAEKKENIQICKKLSSIGVTALDPMERMRMPGLSGALRYHRNRFQQNKFQSYMKAVTESPILLMVKSAAPSDEQLLEVIRKQKDFKSDIVTTIEALDNSKTLDPEKLFDLAYQTGRIPDTAVTSVKKRYPEVKNWDQVRLELENNFATKDIDKMLGKFILNASLLGACTLASGGTATAFCVAGLTAVSLGQLVVGFQAYQSTLLDLAANVDRDVSAENWNEEKLVDQLTEMRVDGLAAVLMILPAIKKMPHKNIVKFIRGIAS